MLGSGIGGALRFLTGKGMSHFGLNFPLGTLTANIAGCLLIGLFCAWSQKGAVSPEVKLMLTVGLCGGFTTFSTFSNENLTFLSNGQWGMFVLYTGISLALGIGAVWLGWTLGK